MFPCAATIWHVAKTINHQRILPFQQFNGSCPVGAKGHRRYTVNAILIRSSAPAAKETIHRRKLSAIGTVSEKMEDIAPFTHYWYFVW